MARKKKKSNQEEKPGAWTGFLFAGLFAGLLLVDLYTGCRICAYLSAIPAFLFILWCIARIG
ncbi:MAG: hypothetical protein ACI3VA_09215 [Candidatus Limivicinus sp.]